MKKILIVAGQFNEMVTRALYEGALRVVEEKRLVAQTVWVPGAFEIPVVAANAARSQKYSAIVALGCVIRGETPHFEIIANESARGLMNISVETGIPVINGILTTNTIEQALNRCGLKHGNKGREAMHAAVEMLNVLETVGKA